MDESLIEGPVEALLLFADVIDSSKYSAVLSYKEYARRLRRFQAIFKSLGHRYFPEATKPAPHYTHVDARGDEGSVFIVDPDQRPGDIVFRALAFVFHLKGCMRFALGTEQDSSAPSRMEIGAGIHFDKVALVLRGGGQLVSVDGIEGYSINYAKRVESCSRDGRYSRVVLSERAARLVEDAPILCTGMECALKGIGDNVPLFEVLSGLFSELRFRDEPEDQALITRVLQMTEDPLSLEEPWFKPFIVSVLDALLADAVGARREEHHERQLKFAWSDVNEHDPILRYIRAKDYGSRQEYTQQVRYLRDLLRDHPRFVHARIRLVEACSRVLEGGGSMDDKVYVRDVAREFLDHFRDVLSSSEVERFEKMAIP